MAAHSKLGASSMYRWSACPGSVRASEGIVSASSKYAEEGTEAHEFAADYLVRGSVAIKPDTDIEMVEAVKEYADHVRSLIEPGKTKMLIEHRFDLSSIYPGCFGTADCVVWDPRTHVLHVVDYKHGQGIAVEAKDNPQLRYYALGALVTCGFPAERVVMTIVQPRCFHPDGPVRSEVIDAIDLLDFSVDLVDYARATEAPDAPLVPGDHCRFCPAAATCPALVSKAQEVAKLEFRKDLSYDPAQLKLALDSRPALLAWLKALDEFAYAEAEAGRCPPGYKLVAKRATRKWRSEGEVVDKLESVLTDAELYEPRTVKSPAQLEKVVDKALFADLVVAESSGHTLVPESDKRPAVKPGAKEEFSVVDA